MCSVQGEWLICPLTTALCHVLCSGIAADLPFYYITLSCVVIRESVSRLFVASRGAVSSSSLVNGPSGGGSVVGIESAQSLRRASSIRRAFTTGTAGIKRRSVALQVKFTVVSAPMLSSRDNCMF